MWDWVNPTFQQVGKLHSPAGRVSKNVGLSRPGPERLPEPSRRILELPVPSSGAVIRSGVGAQLYKGPSSSCSLTATSFGGAFQVLVWGFRKHLPCSFGRSVSEGPACFALASETSQGTR